MKLTKMRALATAAVVAAVGGTALSGVAMAQPNSTAATASRPAQSTSRPSQADARTTYIPGSVLALGKAQANLYGCPSTSCVVTGSINVNLGVTDVCYITVNGAEWDLVFRPNGYVAGWLRTAENVIYNYGGGDLTQNYCAEDPSL